MTRVNVQNARQKIGKLPAKLSEEIPWNEICVDLVGPHKILRKGK